MKSKRISGFILVLEILAVIILHSLKTEPATSSPQTVNETQTVYETGFMQQHTVVSNFFQP